MHKPACGLLASILFSLLVFVSGTTAAIAGHVTLGTHNESDISSHCGAAGGSYYNSGGVYGCFGPGGDVTCSGKTKKCFGTCSNCSAARASLGGFLAGKLQGVKTTSAPTSSPSKTNVLGGARSNALTQRKSTVLNQNSNLTRGSSATTLKKPDTTMLRR
jgi:hypothetical protein